MKLLTKKSVSQLIKKTIASQPVNKIFYTSLFYQKHCPQLSEVNYYKVIERMTKQGQIVKLGKGIFFVPGKNYLTETQNEAGRLKLLLYRKSFLEIGYGLFNRLGLSTQISKDRYFYVSKLNKPVQKVNQFYFIRKNMNFQKANLVEVIELLEVLQNYLKMQDLSLPALYQYLRRILKRIAVDSIDYVLTHMKYKKSTIAFLNYLLETHRGLKNPLGSFLSKVSRYNIPSLGGSFETTITH
jgi:hypothetical protein